MSVEVVTVKVSNSDDFICPMDIEKAIEGLENRKATDPEEFESYNGDIDLQELKDFANDLEGYFNKLSDVHEIVRNSYFEDYARNLADDIHGIADDSGEWPFNHIDWDEAAFQLKMDYVSVNFGGIEYWAR